MKRRPRPIDVLPLNAALNVVVDSAGCWRWQGTTDLDGYARIRVGKRWLRGHRYTYARCAGPIPTGLELDHLCRVRECVNPEHMEPVTRATNQARRGLPPFARVYVP